jgi:hypothetical protein
MKNLIYKELTLSINKFFFFLPFVLAALMFIPNWIFTLVFMYFFWISVPQIFSAYLANADYQFSASLPVRRIDIVRSKSYALLILESLHIISAVIFGLIHNVIYGSWNFFFDINLAFFGVGMLMYAVFNIIFLPMYFKTAHFFGKATLYGTIATLIYGFIFEFGVAKYTFMRDIFEGNAVTQVIVFGITLGLTVILNFIAIKQSEKRFMRVDL